MCRIIILERTCESLKDFFIACNIEAFSCVCICITNKCTPQESVEYREDNMFTLLLAAIAAIGVVLMNVMYG